MRVLRKGSRRQELEQRGATVVARIFVGDSMTEERTLEGRSPLWAKWELDRMTLALTADGYERDGDSSEYVELTSNDFAEALAIDPDDPDTYSVYADWLGEQGDVWGELMGVQVKLASLPRVGSGAERDQLSRHEALLLFRHAARFWGPLGERIIDESTQHYASDCVSGEWYCGFLKRAQVRPLPGIDGVSFSELVTSLAGLPIASLLRELEVSSHLLEPGDIVAIADQKWPLLTSISVSTDAPFHGHGPAIDAAPLALLCDGDRAPRLESLSITGAGDGEALCRRLADAPQAMHLKVLRLYRCQLSDAAITTLAGAQLDALEELVVVGDGFAATARERLADVARKVSVRPMELAPRDD